MRAYKKQGVVVVPRPYPHTFVFVLVYNISCFLAVTSEEKNTSITQLNATLHVVVAVACTSNTSVDMIFMSITVPLLAQRRLIGSGRTQRLHSALRSLVAWRAQRPLRLATFDPRLYDCLRISTSHGTLVLSHVK